jgi:hypothetical protein
LSALRTSRLYTQEYPGTHFKRLSRPRAHGIVGCHGKIPSDTTGDRSRDIPTSSVVPQPLRHPLAQICNVRVEILHAYKQNTRDTPAISTTLYRTPTAIQLLIQHHSPAPRSKPYPHTASCCLLLRSNQTPINTKHERLKPQWQLECNQQHMRQSKYMFIDNTNTMHNSRRFGTIVTSSDVPETLLFGRRVKTGLDKSRRSVTCAHHYYICTEIYPVVSS